MRKTLAALLLVLSFGPAAAQVCAPVPALPDTERRTPYSISAQTGPFNVGFAVYGDSTDYVDWVQVYLNGQLLAPSAFTLTSPSGSLAQICRPITDAQITLTTASTGTVQIVGARRPRRTSQFAENRGVTARDLNQLNTDIIATERERWDQMARVPQVPPGETLVTLPAAATRANQLLGFDANGALLLYTPSGIVTATVPSTVCVNQFMRQIAVGGAGTCQSITAADLPASLGNISGPTLLSTGAQTLSVAPTGNPPTTLASVSAQGNMTSTTVREFLANFGAVNTVTGGVHGTGVDKVTLYAGMINTPNVTINQDQWAFNTVTTMSANTGSVYNSQGYELDFNNLNAHRGDADGGAGLAAPIAYGMNITGASTFRSTAGLLISGVTDQWNRGIVIANNSAKQASFQDLGHATVSIDIRGAHGIGIDLSNGSTFSSAAIRLPNNSPIQAINNAATPVSIISLDGSNVTRIGGGTRATVSSTAGAFPAMLVQNLNATAGDVGASVAAGTNASTDTTSAVMTFAWSNNSTTVGSITRAAGNTVAFNTSSDARLKNVVGDASGCVAQISRVKVRDFTWKSDPRKAVYRGYIAQEINGIFPQAVHVGGRDAQRDPWGVDYGKVTPLDTCAIQELAAENAALRARLDRIERRLPRRGG